MIMLNKIMYRNKYKNIFRFCLFCIFVIAGRAAHATDNDAMDAAVRQIDDRWAHITYQVTDKDERLKEIDALSHDADLVVIKYPDQVEPLLWQGIVVSEEAGMASVFDQLGLARRARDILQKAMQIDPQGAKGAVAMSLGVLYYRVPGFPIAFGNDTKARSLLQIGLKMDPDGMDANFFYGDFLLTQDDYADAQKYLTHALAAPFNPARPVWEAGRRAEIEALLTKISKHNSDMASSSP